MIIENLTEIEDQEDLVYGGRYPLRHYDKQETCEHKTKFTLKYNNGKIWFQCGICRKTLSEDHLGEIMGVLEREYEVWKNRDKKLIISNLN